MTDDVLIIREETIVTVDVTAPDVVTIQGGEETRIVATEVESVTVADDAPVVVEAGHQGPPGPPGPQGTAAIPARVVIASGQTRIIESIPMAAWRSAKWMVTITHPQGNRYRTSEVLAMHDDADAHFIHYGLIGAPIRASVEVIRIGNDLALRVTNAEGGEVVADAVRTGHLPTQP